MLQGMQAEVGKRLRLRMGVDRNYTTLIAKFIAFSHQLSALSFQ
jgi:hypothetical protein